VAGETAYLTSGDPAAFDRTLRRLAAAGAAPAAAI
jgi:hypothetical protein